MPGSAVGKHSRRRWVLGIVAGGVLAVLGGFGWAGWSIATYSCPPSEEQVDAAMVLGAAVDEDGPSPVFRERINHGISLYRAGKVRKLVFTGGYGEGDTRSEAAVAGAYCVARGVPETAVILEEKSRTTEQNLYYGAEAGAAQGLGSFYIISDPLHMKRAMLMAADLGLDARPSPTPTTMYRSFGTRTAFLLRESYYYLKYLCRRWRRSQEDLPK
jgi:uncharacterized SAM-binding protein YcdF (DUF218 family)